MKMNTTHRHDVPETYIKPDTMGPSAGPAQNVECDNIVNFVNDTSRSFGSSSCVNILHTCEWSNLRREYGEAPGSGGGRGRVKAFRLLRISPWLSPCFLRPRHLREQQKPSGTIAPSEGSIQRYTYQPARHRHSKRQRRGNVNHPSSKN